MAVVVSLVYLALQIRQNTRSTRAQMLQQHQVALQSQLVALGSNVQASRVLNAGLRSWTDLSEEEQGQFGLIIAGILQGFESTFHQYRAGLLSYELWDNYRTRLRWYVAREGVRSWLKLSGHTWASPEFGAIVDELVSESE